MKITRENYELFAIDFVDGSLSPTEVAEFLVFLANNSDISSEVELLRDVAIKSPLVEGNPDFSFLKKELGTIDIDKKNFEEYCIAYHENDLQDGAKKKLLQYIDLNPELNSKFELYSNLKLTPDTRVVFPQKRLLKKNNAHLNNRRVIAAVALLAASFLLFFMFRVPYNTPTPTLTSEINTATFQTPNDEIVVAENNNEKAFNLPEKKVETKNVCPRKNSTNKKEVAEVADNHSSYDRPNLVQVDMIDINCLEKSDNYKEIKINYNSRSPEIIDRETIEPDKEETQIMSIIKNLKLNDVIRTGIKGLNQIAETDLEYNTKTDEQGRVTEFALSSGNFNIHKKLRN